MKEPCTKCHTKKTDHASGVCVDCRKNAICEKCLRPYQCGKTMKKRSTAPTYRMCWGCRTEQHG